MRTKKPIKLIIWGCIIILAECVIAWLTMYFSTYTESLYYISQIFNCVVVALGVLYAAWQYNQSTQDAKRNMDIIRVQKAIDMAQFFKDHILNMYPPVNYIFKNSNIYPILRKMPHDAMKNFDYTEMRKYIFESDSLELKRIQEDDIFLMSLLEANSIYGMNIKLTGKTNINEDGDIRSATVSIEKHPVIASFMRNYIDETLNNLEFFAMHFAHNTADSSVVYQSLHQIYIQIVEDLYYFIAVTNTDSVDKYYTNVIALYKRWVEKRNENEEKRAENDSSFQTHGTVIK